MTKLTNRRSIATVTTQVNVAEAKAKLSDLVERAANGEDIVIARAGKPRVRLVSVPAQTEPRRFGQLKGQIWYGHNFYDDLTDEFEVLRDVDEP